MLETTSTSITRLKQRCIHALPVFSKVLKRQVPRLRDWNSNIYFIRNHFWFFTWNDKYLDYEIETQGWRAYHLTYYKQLETTSTSITRLKPYGKIPHIGVGRNSWNDKYLDYEIETSQSGSPWESYLTLKRQVPRLRDWNRSTFITEQNRRPTWNDKYLDYEIETIKPTAVHAPLHRILETTSTSITRLKLEICRVVDRSPRPWNDKYLDYEIETCIDMQRVP